MVFMVLTASGSEELSHYTNGFDFYTGDETTLKTIVRSNPGYLLLKNGTIAGKWSHASLPRKERLNSEMTAAQVEKMNRKSPVLTVYSLMLSVIIISLLISSILIKPRGGSEN
jgi:triosephosphate isomerase